MMNSGKSPNRKMLKFIFVLPFMIATCLVVHPVQVGIANKTASFSNLQLTEFEGYFMRHRSESPFAECRLIFNNHINIGLSSIVNQCIQTFHRGFHYFFGITFTFYIYTYHRAAKCCGSINPFVMIFDCFCSRIFIQISLKRLLRQHNSQVITTIV